MKREKIGNVTAIAGKTDDPRLPVEVDLIVMVDVFHHIADRAAYLKKLQGALKPGGRIAIIDFRMDSPDGPPPSARLTPDSVKGEFKAAGYALAQEHAFLPNQYFLVFQPTKR